MLRISRPFLKHKNIQLKQFRKSSNKENVKPGQSLKEPPPPLNVVKPNKKGGSGFLKYVVAIAVGAPTGVIAYAWYDQNFRKTVEDNVPFSKGALEIIFSLLPAQASDTSTNKTVSKKSPTENEVPSKLQSKLPAPGEAFKQIENATKQEPEFTKKTEPKPKAELTVAQKKEDEKRRKEENKKHEEEAKSQEKERRKKEKEAQELEIKKQLQEERHRVEKAKQEKQSEEAAQNAALELMLVSALQESNEAVEKAIEAQKAATAVTVEHSNLLKKAMDSTGEIDGIEGQWEAVTKAHSLRVQAVETADELANNARLSMEKLKAAVKGGKENKVTKANECIREAESSLKQKKYEFENSVAEVTKAISESKIMKEYRDLIKKGKEQFKQELESLMPDVKIKQGWGGKMSEEDLNSLIAHAHRRIEQLQKQIAEQQAMEATRTEMALNRQKEEDDKMARSCVRREREKMFSEFEIEKLKWDAEAKLQQDDETRKQLTRQAAAHSDHLIQILKVQQEELRSHYDILVEERLLKERALFNEEIGGHIARLKGIESAVEGRAELEKQGRKAQELWLACQTVANIIQQQQEDINGEFEEKIKPLEKEVMAIQEAGYGHPFVMTVIESFPEEALMNGVSSENALRERFHKVRKICKRVAAVDETNKSLHRYIFSYMQSLFVFSQGKPLSEKDEINPDELTTYVILDNAEYHMEKGNLVQALRFMNMLKGEARLVSTDWIKEARLLSATKQAGEALLAHASASGLGSLM